MLRFGTLALGLTFFAFQACNIADGLADLGDSLLDPDAALLDRPGRKLVGGTYQRLLIDGSLENGGYVLAMRVDTPEQRLAIVPFLEGASCEVKDARGFERLSSRVDVALDGLVAVQVSGEVGGKGKIRFVGFDCEDRMAALEDATLPRIEFPTDVPRGLLTLTGSKDLYLASAETHELELVAPNVDFATVADDRLWTKENGKLVIRNADLDIEATLGSGLVSFVVTGGTPEVAFQDEKGVHVWSKTDDVRTLAADGCAPVAVDTASVAYYSPCASRTMLLDVPGSKVGSKQARVTLQGPSDVLGLTGLQLSYGLGQDPTTLLFVTAADAAATTGDLQLASFVAADLPSSGPLLLPLKNLASDAVVLAGNVFLHWDGTKGDLVERIGEQLVPMASGVAQLPGGSPYSARGALVRYDGNLGDLVQLVRNGDEIEETLIGKDVPIQYQGLEGDGNAIAFIANFDGEAGEVRLFDGSKSKTLAPLGIKDTLRFLDQPRAVAFLAPRKNGDGAELHAYLLDSALDLLIHEHVSEYRPVPWPSPGILYAVPAGDDAGLWFSKAR